MTAVTELKQISAERFIVSFDSAAPLTVSLSVVAAHSLYKGRELSDGELRAVAEASKFERSKDRALRMIGTRPMSRRELLKKLCEKGENPEDAEKCADWLERLHLLDDNEYARMTARHYAARGYGRKRVESELWRRGVPKELWDAAFDELPATDDGVYKLLRSKLKSADPSREELKKAADFLFRRGFSWDEIQSAVEKFRRGGED